jgi:hypothetical protein
MSIDWLTQPSWPARPGHPRLHRIEEKKGRRRPAESREDENLASKPISTARADSERLGTIRPGSALSRMPRIWSRDVPFLNRLLLHYGIYRRYPLRPWPALKNAWRVAWR